MEKKIRSKGIIALAVAQLILAVCVLLTIPILGVISIFLGVLMIVTAVGYLKLDYKLGFIGGNILGIGLLINIFILNSLQEFVYFKLYIPSFIFPTLLLILLNNRYKKSFVENI